MTSSPDFILEMDHIADLHFYFAKGIIRSGLSSVRLTVVDGVLVFAGKTEEAYPPEVQTAYREYLVRKGA